MSEPHIIDPEAFASAWIDAWNQRDIDLLVSLIYRREVDNRRDRAVEIFHFRSDGLVDSGEALYGAKLTS